MASCVFKLIKILSIVSEVSLGRLRLRGAHRREQLQHILASPRREENIFSVRQPREGAADANSCEQAAGQPLLVRSDPHQEMGGPRREVHSVCNQKAPRQAEEAPQEAHAASLHAASTQTESETEAEAQEG